MFKELTGKKTAKEYNHINPRPILDGDDKNSLGTLLQCLMSVEPIKDYFLNEEYKTLPMSKEIK